MEVFVFAVLAVLATGVALVLASFAVTALCGVYRALVPARAAAVPADAPTAA